MQANRNSRRWLAGGFTLLVLVLVLAGMFLMPNRQEEKAQAAPDMERVWALFGGSPSRNMVSTTEKGMPTDWLIEKKDDNGKVTQKGKNIKWVARLGSRAYGGPVIAGGKVFVGTNNEAPRNPKIKGDKGIVMCFNEADGKFLWQAVHDKLLGGQVNDWPREGICSTPAVDGNRIYYVSNRCELICADVEGFRDGKNDGVQDETLKGEFDADIVWKVDLMAKFNVYPHNMAAGCPVIVDDLVYIVTGNGVDEGHVNIPQPGAPSFMAVNKKTGEKVWMDSSPGRNIMHGQWSNPAFAVVNGQAQVIFPGGDGWLRGFEAKTGKEIWKFDGNPKNTKYELAGRGTKSDFVGTPVVYDNKVFIGTGQDPEHYEGVAWFWCIDLLRYGALSKGDISAELLADAKSDPPKGKPNPNSAVVWQFGGPVPRAEVEKLGRDYYFGRTMSTCAIHDGLVYQSEVAGYFHVLDLKTGKKLWDHDLKAAIWGSPYWVDGKVYLANEDGDVYVFEHGRQKTFLGKVEMEESIKTTPVAVNGVLYVMTENNLYAISGK